MDKGSCGMQANPTQSARFLMAREYNKLDANVNLDAIARRTKNFSGAELEGLVRAAQSSAMNRLVKAGGKVQVDDDAVEKLKVTAEDFDYALENDVKPVRKEGKGRRDLRGGGVRGLAKNMNVQI